MKSKNIIIKILLIIFSINVITGCTQNKNNTKPKEEKKSKNLSGDIEITISDDRFGEFLKNNIIPDFKKDNPDVNVSLSSDNDINSRVMNGKVPDIYIGNNVYEAMKYGDMNKLLDFQKVNGFKNDLYKKISKKFIVKKQKTNEIYCIPWFVTTQLMAYNKTLFREAGLDEKKPPSTFDEFINCANRIYALPNRADGSKIYGVAVPNNDISNPISNWENVSPLYYNMNDKKYGLYNNTGTDVVFDKSEAKLNDFFVFVSKVQQVTSMNLKNADLNNTGMWLQYGDEENINKDDIGISNIPAKDKNSISYSNLKEKNIMMFKTDTKRQDLAWNFVKYIMEEQENLKACKKLKELPVLSKLEKNDYFKTTENKKYMEQLKNAIPIEPYPSIEKVTANLQQAYIDYAVNKKVPLDLSIKNAADKSRNIIKNTGE
ncbi:carbohydrate ABC transporter substrate-binding protein, CUT1 family [Clostridium acidisoli DSM 12555]|uniref:Carbohydrate ABC transporter substrate-binding protein, CUT1 family n=1 Tax=Clostridium acidisoli DSM 12555 TaxID=1121291 RepID=A0A1W1XGF4_9CLOT|nr:extracellular solute-binding protein [Clostridium acidisoli]SMC22872.1 carbohydrate ABC transporter substrate-binding protein, CUT1 family [Clostridium acidisoli DSM 12555]